jgi:predicted site-specific integrase-resolvase
MGHTNIKMKTHSTAEVAEMVGITWDTLHRWMREKKIPTPPTKTLGKVKVRLWAEADVEEIRKYKAHHYWGKGGRKKRKKRAN